MSGAAGQVLCIALFLAAVIGAIRLRLRVGRLPGLAARPGRRGRRGSGEHDAHPRELDVDDDDDDGGDGDGGDA